MGHITAGDSMPMIQMSYDNEEPVTPTPRPVSVSDLAASATAVASSQAGAHRTPLRTPLGASIGALSGAGRLSRT